MSKTKDLTEGAILPHILRMAIPMLIGTSSHMLLNIIDGVYVSRLGLEPSLAVLNYGFPFFYLIFAVFNGLTSGSSSVLARYLGSKENAKAENAMSQIVWVGLGLFALFLVLYPFILPYYLSAQKVSPTAAVLTRNYLNSLFLGVPFLVLVLLWGSGLRAEGNTRTLMSGMMVGTFLNIGFAPFLIFRAFRFAGIGWHGLGLGVTGAGLASAVANAISLLVVLSIFLRRGTVLRLRLWPDWSDRGGLKEAFKVGLPSIISQSLIGINVLILTKLASDFGPAAVSAIGIGARLDTLAVFPSLSIMVAVLSLVGQNYGAGRYDRVSQTVRQGLTLAFFTLGTIGLVTHFCRGPLLAKFHPDPAAYPSAYHFLGITTLGYAFAGMSIVSSGAFQGLGRGLPFLFLNTLRLLGIAAPLGWLLAHFYGEYGLHYAPLIASGCSALIAVTWILAATSRLRRQEAPARVPAAAAAA